MNNKKITYKTDYIGFQKNRGLFTFAELRYIIEKHINPNDIIDYLIHMGRFEQDAIREGISRGMYATEIEVFQDKIVKVLRLTERGVKELCDWLNDNEEDFDTFLRYIEDKKPYTIN